MESRAAIAISEFIIFLSLLLSAYYYAFLPDEIAVHWGVDGSPDGFLPKYWILIFPIIYAGIVLLVWALPFADPLRKNVDQFRGQYDWFVLILSFFLAAVQVLTLGYNLGWVENMADYVMLLASMVIFFAGYLTFIAKRNWFIGIRTPWTLSSERSWRVTNRVGGALFMLFALLLPIFNAYLGAASATALIFGLLAVVVFLYALSYYVYLHDSNRQSPK